MTGTQNDIANRLDALFSAGLKISSPISSLLIMRSKIVFRGFKTFDERIVGEIHSEMLRVEDIVKRNSEPR